ncbi:MAG: hypothetical protein ACI9F9_001171, partial [Candidatus Paceibacteria bacterium]
MSRFGAPDPGAISLKQACELVFTDGAGNAATSSSISTTEGWLGGELRHHQYRFRDVGGVCG